MTHRRDSHPTVVMVIRWAWESMPFRLLLAVAALLMLSVNYTAGARMLRASRMLFQAKFGSKRSDSKAN